MSVGMGRIPDDCGKLSKETHCIVEDLLRAPFISRLLLART